MIYVLVHILSQTAHYSKRRFTKMTNESKATNQGLSEAAKAARRAYRNKWNAQNQDKVKEHMRRYWEKKAADAERENNDK
jgi:hypothetical protein